MKIREITQDIEKQITCLSKTLELLKQENAEENIEQCKNSCLFYTMIANYSVQRKAPLSDKYIISKLNFQSVKASEDRGDAKDTFERYYELKTSFTNKENKLNLRQIRLWQDVDFYYCFFINERDFTKSIVFSLTKEQMAQEVQLIGSATHGTNKANQQNENIEYSITIDIYNLNNKNTKRWYDKYRNPALMEVIFGGIR